MLDIVKAEAAVAGGVQPGLGAVRCLFGKPDPEETRLFQQTELRKIAEEQSHRWNFDFDEGRPLLGRYRWELCAGGGGGGGDDDDAPSAGGRASARRSAPRGSGDAAAASRQARISDYFPKRKRLGGVVKPKTRANAMCGGGSEAVAVIRPQAVRAAERQLPPSPTLLASSFSSSSSSSLTRAQSDQ